MYVTVDRQDPRFETLKRGHNLRFPGSAADAASRVALCTTAGETAEALQKAVSAGLRPTVRSGGHCYEDFVANNPSGCILDISLLNQIGSEDGAYFIEPGAMLGDVYQSLYKRYALTLPAGTCYSVGAGGHISGGGYGLLSRLHGLTCDWITGLDVLTIDAHGKVVKRRVDATHDPDLLRAMRGAGNGNFGVITRFRFAKLPPAPREVAEASLSFPWEDMEEEQFAELLAEYSNYWATRGRDPETWGLFVIFVVGARGPGGRLGMHVQFCQPDGTANDLSVLHEYLDRFRKYGATLVSRSQHEGGKSGGRATAGNDATVPPLDYKAIQVQPWIDATISGGGGGGGSRAKYKSAYMTKPFTAAEAATIYRFFSGGSEVARSSVISMDSYGGAVNKVGLAEQTSIPQRNSILKLQWQCYWRDASQDDTQLRQLQEFYTALYTGEHVDAQHQGTPYGDRYEGCYMNYADADMLRYPYWPELYFGRGELYPFLQNVKHRYDPNNVFHYSMSVRPKPVA